MAGAGAVLAFAVVCCLLVAPVPARLPVDLPPGAVDREAAAEKLLPKPPVQAAYDAEAADYQATAIAVPEEEGLPVGEDRPQKRSSLLCLVFRCGGDTEPTRARGSSSEERQALLEGWAHQPAVAGTAEVHGDSDSDWDSDCNSDDEDHCDSDSDDEGGILGWFWRLVDGF